MHFQKMAWHASQHYIALNESRHRYPHYQHHRGVHLPAYASYWSRSWFRKGMRRGADRNFQQWLFSSGQQYYFVPLQLEGDSQITQHSSFSGTAEFVVQVLHSYARYAPRDTMLVFRQHPHSRGGPGDAALIRAVAASLGLGTRVHHMVEGDTPDLAEHSLGTIVINSTVGVQALERGVPLIVLGDAPYKRPAFTFTGGLDKFWHDRGRPDAAVTGAFLAQVKHLTQMPASVYALRSEPLAWGSDPHLPIP
jgi:capsular polysaccharide export protein